MADIKAERIDYLTLLGYVTTLGIKVYNSSQIKKFADSEPLGSGSSMIVYRGELIENTTSPNCERIPVAIKVPKTNTRDMNRDSKASKVLANVRQELRMMKHFETHPNIISLYGVVFQDLKPLTIVELAEESITDYLAIMRDEHTPVCWETKVRFCCEVADGLQAIHAANIVHGDLKGENILLFKGYQGRLVAKITDFGYSATAASIERGGNTGGSLHFLAPECTEGASKEIRKYENKSLKDNYAFGLFVWQVARDGAIPYDEMHRNEILKLKNTDKNLDKLMGDLEKNTPHYFRDVIKAMTRYIPKEREALTKVREMMEIDISSDLSSFAVAKNNLESYAKDLPRDIAKADLSSIELMSIPHPLKAKIYRSYEKAATDGDADSMFMMAICHSTGFAVEMDKVKALDWCIKAASAGSLDAMVNIAQNYKIENLYIKPDVAFPWYLKAAEMGYKNAISQVVYYYSGNNGVGRDKEKAYYWLNVHNSIASTSEVNMNIGETSLHRAARLGNVEAVIFLLEQRDADINTKNNDGETALHTAAQCGQIEAVKLLIATFGADANARTSSGRTSLELAAGRGHIEIVRLFEDETVITNLNLSLTKLGPEEARLLATSLKMYSALNQLDLKNNSIGDKGVCALAESLKQNSILTYLNLWNNNIGAEGAYALAEYLKQNSTLKQLELGGNNIGDSGACALAKSLKRNSVLSHLNLWNNNISNVGTCALAECLRYNLTLTQFYFGWNSIDVKGTYVLAECLKRNSALTRLVLENHSIDDEGAIALAECLKQNSTLTQLELGGNNIGDKGAYALAKCLKQNSALTQLELGRNSIGDKGACALAEYLKQNLILIQLELGQNRIGIEGAYTLAVSLKQNSTLIQLGLGWNHIGTQGASAMAECLKHNSTLMQLDLKCNHIGTEGAWTLAECLEQNTTLTQLVLWGNYIDDEGACALAECLKHNLTLTHLELGYNNISDKGALALTENIKQNSALLQLSFEGNKISSEIQNLLKQNTVFILDR